MSMITDNVGNTHSDATTALEVDFPIVQISSVAEQESWRKEINRPLYHIHKWWATRLGSVFRGIAIGALSSPKANIWEMFYKEHSLKDKVVLDPFMGSGTTLGESAKLGAKVIGCDINPVSTFLVRQAFTQVSEEALRASFNKLEEDVAPEIRRYYQTHDRETGELIPVLYYFWVKVVKTPDGEEIPLFSKYVFSQNAYPKKKPKAQILCPNCWAVIEDRYDSQDLACPSCEHSFNPQQGTVSGQFVRASNGRQYKIKDLLPKTGLPLSHKMYALMALRHDGTKVYLSINSEDKKLYKQVLEKLDSEELPLPIAKVRPGHNTDQIRGYNYNNWRDLFNPRQLLCLGMLLKAILKIEDRAVQEQMICLFSSTLEFNNMFCSFKGEGTGAVRHMFSNHILKPERTPLENSVWGHKKSSGTFSTLFESRLLRAKRYLKEPFELSLQFDLLGKKTGTSKIVSSKPIESKLCDDWDDLYSCEKGVLALNGDSSNLPIPDCSVDAVITDPPYFDFVHYSELSDFFFAWLSPVLRTRYDWIDRQDSSDIGEVQNKDVYRFATQLSLVFKESCRVLKDDGVLAFSFHHSRSEGWAAIYDAINKAGLAVVTIHPVHAELRGASPKSSAKEPISLDAILVCRKKAYALKGDIQLSDILKAVDVLSDRLESAGMRISNGDRFVIGASELLVSKSSSNLSFDEVKLELDKVRNIFLGARPTNIQTN